ncbi:MAG: hypothetical protein HY261_05140 [Chloroflexi bacterium]|nr:hypothetical protein [Chloroflexota bacterium]
MRVRIGRWQLGAGLLVAVVVSGALAATTAGNTVPASRLGQRIATITANDLKPSECGALTLTTRIIAATAGTTNGSAGNDLILGGPGNQTINGNGGNDCVVGGGGKDTVDGGPGTDICIVSTTSTVKNCETVVRR